jgi:hypothetical protein
MVYLNIVKGILKKGIKMSDRITTAEIVFMENELRTVFNRELPKVKAVLRPCIGQKIQKADCSLLKKIQEQIKLDDTEKVIPLREGGFAHIHWLYVKSSAYSLWLECSLCFSGGKYEDKTYYCQYKSNSVWIASVSNGILCPLNGIDSLPEINDEAEQNNLLNAIRLKKEYEAALSLLLPATKEANYLK